MATSAGTIVVVDSYMRDTTFRTVRLPRPGETIAATGVSSDHGGKGSNQAVQVARCGARVNLIAAVGDDTAGQAARDLWTAEAVDHRSVASYAGESTGMAFITVDDRGENQILIAPGANQRLSAADVERSAATLAGAAAVLAQLETPVGATSRAFEFGRKVGAMTVLNAAPLAAPETLGPLLALTDLIVCNLGEAQDLLGNNTCDPARICDLLAERIDRAALVTVGSGGAYLQPGPGQVALYQPANAARRVAEHSKADDGVSIQLIAT